MSSLSMFPSPPPVGFTSVCEASGELVAAKMGEEGMIQAQYCGQVGEFPSLHFPPDSIRASREESSAKAAFLPHDETVWKRAKEAWYEHGLGAVLSELVTSRAEVPGWLGWSSSAGLAVVRWLGSLHGSLFPHLALSNEDMIATFAENADWYHSAIRAFSWHPHIHKFAIALRDNSIKVYSRTSKIIPLLKHKVQKGVAALAWEPQCASVLAVGCQNCVLIWHVDPMSLSSRPSTTTCQVLTRPGHSPITCLAWSPHGKLLASASPADTAMMIWSVSTETGVPLRRVGGGGVSLLRWSPDGNKLFAATPSSLLRVWETETWTCERWTNLAGRCQSSCWSPDGAVLLFTVADEPVIYSITFPRDADVVTSVKAGSKSAVVCVDVSQVAVEVGEEVLNVGGSVHSMVWDPRGERLAVIFTADPEKGTTSQLIALFRTRLHPVLEIMPCGFIRGEPGVSPELISFQENFESGALLAVCWSNGKLSFIPLMFVPSDDVNRIPRNGFGNGTVFTGQIFSQQ
ncbi:aladin-like [Branchiostoma lanceolatum]|uniref:aladin-like n=1 Tax=Branchiostoma lanceolatum TaxID=7740 RepID=UPI00345348D7